MKKSIRVNELKYMISMNKLNPCRDTSAEALDQETAS